MGPLGSRIEQETSVAHLEVLSTYPSSVVIDKRLNTKCMF